MKKSLIILTLALGLTCGTYAQTYSGRIVVVDLNKIFNDYYKTPIASAKLKETAEGFNKEHQTLVADYQKLVEEVKKLQQEQDKPEYTAAVREEKSKLLKDKLADANKKQQEINEFLQIHKRQLDEQTQRMRQTILKEISEVIQKESRDTGYMLVLDKSGNTLNGVPGVVYGQDSIDITDSIIKILNKNAPKEEKPKTP